MKNIIFFIFSGVLFISQISTFSQAKKLSLSHVWGTEQLIPNSIDEIRSMNDGETYTVLKNNEIVQYSYKTGKKIKTVLNGDKIMHKGELHQLIIEDYEFSRDESMVLLTTDKEYIYRRSYLASHYMYMLKTAELIPVSEKGKQRLCEISPDGLKVAFVRDNNIFLMDIKTGIEMQVTADGEFNKIINGVPDWVYEEEFGFSKGFFWSADGNKILYYKFDESNVKEFTLNKYFGNEYPELYTYKYPKAGEDNSVVKIYVYHLNDNSHVEIDTGEEKDIYFPRIGWTKNENMLWFQRLNRHQNFLEIILADSHTGKSKTIYTETNKYYIDITDNLTFLNDKQHFIITSEKDGFNHLYLYNLNGNEICQITKGNYDILSIENIDEKRKVIFYTSSENQAINQMLYSISFDGKNKKRLFDREGYYKAQFSKNSRYFILTFSDVNTPPQYIIYSSDGKKLVELENNFRFVEKIKDFNFAKTEFFSFYTSENIQLNAWCLKPEKTESYKEYPVLLYVYGGPGSQTVRNQWGGIQYIWFQYLVQNGIIVVSVDNRGTGGRGEEFKKCTYLQLGKLETADIIETVKYLSTLPYVDKDRIGVFGWSYGGFLASLCMTKGSDFFKTGVAVAPVTNWRYYDNIYTERYMRTPQENPDGYDKNSPVFYADKLKNPFLIIHGDADDNVHAQNTYELINAFIDNNKQFELMIYPNKNHGIYGKWTRYHLFTIISEFLFRNF